MAETPGKMYALATVLTLVATTAVGLRFKARFIRKAALDWDDYTIALALLFTIGTAICMFVGTSMGGLGRHTQMGPDGMPIMDRRVQVFQQVSYASNLTATITLGLTKISVLLLYKRIFRGTARARVFVVIVWTLISIVCLWTVAFFFANVFQCNPISVNWTGSGGSAEQCIDENMMYVGQASSDAISDFLILLIPIPCIWALQLPLKQKFAVCSMFLLGALTIASSITKLVIFYHIALESIQGNVDFTYLFTPTIYWPMVESSLGIVGACLPLLKPVITEYSPLQSIRSLLSLSSTSRTTLRDASSNERAMEEGKSKTSLVSSEASYSSLRKPAPTSASQETKRSPGLPQGKYTVAKVGRIHLMREKREERCPTCGHGR